MRTKTSTARQAGPRTHPAGEVLADYAAGQLHRFQRWLLEAHLEYCPACRGLATAGSRAGGRWLEQLPAEGPSSEGSTSSEELWQRLEARLDAEPATTGPGPLRDLPIPAAVRDEIAREAADALWQQVLESSSAALRVGFDPATELEFFVVRTPAGQVFPRHRHHGGEDLLVIRGSLHDDYGTLSAGDYWHYPSGSSHAPRMGDGEECVALTCVRGGVSFDSP